jgi:hypothetical protein
VVPVNFAFLGSMTYDELTWDPGVTARMAMHLFIPAAPGEALSTVTQRRKPPVLPGDSPRFDRYRGRREFSLSAKRRGNPRGSLRGGNGTLPERTSGRAATSYPPWGSMRSWFEPINVTKTRRMRVTIR